MYTALMPRVYLADNRTVERSALQPLLLDLNMEVVGEASDWLTTLAQVSVCRADMLLVDWDLLPSSPIWALVTLRKVCPAALVIIIIGHLDSRRQQAALSTCADAYISKGEAPDRVAEYLCAAAARIPQY